MLQKIAGLTKARAQAILDTRDSVGYFHNREQASSTIKLTMYLNHFTFTPDNTMSIFLALSVKLQVFILLMIDVRFILQIKSIKGIGPKSYEQCIGFLRIYPNQPTKNSDETAECEF